MSLYVHESDEGIARVLNAHKKRGVATVQSMVSTLRSLREGGVDLYDVDEFQAYIEDMALSTQGKYCCHVYQYLQAKDKTDIVALLYKKRMMTVQKQVEEKYQDSAFTDIQKAKSITWTDLIQTRDQLGKEVATTGNIATMYKHLLLCLYTMIPPQRCDYGNVKIVSQEGGDQRDAANAYVKTQNNSDYIVLRVYKTSSSYGRRTIPLPPALVAAVRSSLQLLPRDWLVAATDPTKPAGKAGVSKKLGSCLVDDRLGCNIIRKIVTTEFARRGEGGAAELAKGMAHSTAVSAMCYNDHRRRQPNSMGIHFG